MAPANPIRQCREIGPALWFAEAAESVLARHVLPSLRSRFERRCRDEHANQPHYLTDPEPDAKLLHGTRSIKLLAPFGWRDERKREWWAYTGFVSDGASIPRFAWGLVGGPLSGLYRNAAILHDAYYADPRGCKRADVDKMFLGVMAHDGVGVVKRQTMYRMVRLFGWSGWVQRRQRSESPRSDERARGV
jgi:hypothetical protein